MDKLLVCFALLAVVFGVHAQQYENLLVSQSCLGCICEAISGCTVTSTCFGNVCGGFGITKPYWSDAGNHTTNNESPTARSAYKNCVLDTYCAALTVQGYMLKFQQDCNRDGKIDCDDFAAIHYLGGHDCEDALPVYYRQRYQQCKELVERVGRVGRKPL